MWKHYLAKLVYMLPDDNDPSGKFVKNKKPDLPIAHLKYQKRSLGQGPENLYFKWQLQVIHDQARQQKFSQCFPNFKV